MDRKQELRHRIVQGIKKVDELSKITDKLPKGKSRDKIGEKSIRVMVNLNQLEDGFIELYLGECLFEDRKCSNQNKGYFPCWNCVPYINALYGRSGEPVATKLL